jgi:hypothetical protein
MASFSIALENEFYLRAAVLRSTIAKDLEKRTTPVMNTARYIKPNTARHLFVAMGRDLKYNFYRTKSVVVI